MTLTTVPTIRSAHIRPTGVGPDVREVPVAQLVLADYRPRQRFLAAALESLAQSIAVHGVTQPLTVRPLDTDLYEIVAGERRYLAAQQLGLSHLPVLVRPLGDDTALEVSLMENLQREDLNELEEAEGILRLLSLRLGREVGAVKSMLYRMDNEAKHKVTQQVLGTAEARTVETVFAVVGRLAWPSFVSTRLPLFSLPPEVMEALRAGVLSAAGARLLGRVRDEGDRRALLADLWVRPVTDAELRRQVLSTLSSPQPAAPLAARLNAWSSALIAQHRWHSPARQARAQALLDELAALLCAEEDDHDEATL
ncbi:ParB/RepB/Spo0J family partition protein [Deinococcus koreensis]|uniref:Chromosome partitioning protein ParB n=1 Tax=Deinococcus koreensis TaxID=2054903 RepID=A0A2K3USZ0_9DEIO|nr:ParB/RepB/Spo0J family partition protein [Deinococcus koreensis]PNY79654.1 chromosome partitioning protein ParB [Deinococcus koreensis]